jgi:hypothetical protein
MVKRSWIFLVILIFLLSACTAQATPSSSGGFPAATPARGASAPQTSSDKSLTGNYATTSSEANSNADAQRLVIMNANLSIVVPAPAATLDFITTLAKNMGGYVVSSNLYKTTTENGAEFPAASVTIRVPADKLNDAMTQIKSQVKNPATDIQSETVSGQDVTKEYTDLQSQLVNLQQAEKQLQSIMDSATKTEDVLNVFNQLTQVQSQIEVLQGQIKYYEESAALSAISVNIAAEASITPLTIGGWEPVGVARNAVQALIDGLQLLGTVAIWGVLFCLPIFLVIGVPIYFVWRVVRRRRIGRKQDPLPTSNLPVA